MPTSTPDPASTAGFLEHVYDELRTIAESYLAARAPGESLQATGLVHEVYLRLRGRSGVGWENRRHFFFAAARAMRDILVEQQRRKIRRRRLLTRRDADPDQLALAAPGEPEVDLLVLHEAIKRLEQESMAKAELVTLRFFAGLTVPQIAELLGRSTRSVERDWRFTRAWLQAELGGSEGL